MSISRIEIDSCESQMIYEAWYSDLVEGKVVQFSVSLSAQCVVQGAQLLQKSQIRLALAGLAQQHESLCGSEVLLLHQICSHNCRGTRIAL